MSKRWKRKRNNKSSPYVKCINCSRLYSTLEYNYVCRRCILTEQDVNMNRQCNQFNKK